MSKSNEQWCADNGVPPNAKHSYLHNGYDTIMMLNHLLRKKGLRIRTKQRRGQLGSYVWVESIKDES